ncbi:MAG: MBL fold metallo-hydrolase, partial [Lachnospiraceae bacterium]|nr:MBL fold metallo-hydrolase [Lachnospiraceae bacterium]
GLGVLARKYEIPIYATEGTLAEIRNVKSLGEYPEELLKPLRPDVKMTLGDLDILPFHIDHDAADPVAYRVQSGNKSVAVATDLGHYNQYTIDHLLDLDAVLLESNHDLRMLESGPYPYYLKRRIMGNFGHLSNENAGRLLNCILNDKMKYVLLGHLSKENNLPELAFETVRLEVDMGDCPYCTSDFYMTVAERDEMSEIMTL